MKKQFLVSFLFFFISFNFKSQTWEKYYPLTSCSSCQLRSADFSDTNGGVILRSDFSVSNNSVIKLNSFGDTLWDKNISIPNKFWVPEQTILFNNNIIIAGYDQNSIGHSFNVVELNPQGNVINIDSISTQYSQPGSVRIEKTHDENYFYIMNSADSSWFDPNWVYHFSTNHIISKYQNATNKIWTKKISNVDSINGLISTYNYLLKPTLDGGVIYDKTYTLALESDSTFIYKLDANGNQQWSLYLRNYFSNIQGTTVGLRSVICTQDSGYIFVVHRYTTTEYDCILKTDKNGVLTDSVSLPAGVFLTKGVETSDGKLLFIYYNYNSITSTVSSTGFLKYDYGLNLLSSTLNPLSEYYIHGATNFIKNNSGGAFITTINSFAANFDSIFSLYPNHVNSKIILDNNNNCFEEPSDHHLNNSVLKLTDSTNNDFYAFGDYLGNYKVSIPNGSYTITHALVGHKEYECPLNGQTNYNTSLTSNFNYTFFDTIIPNINDVNIMLSGNGFRQNDTTSFNVYCYNEGTAIANGSISIIKNSCLQLISSTPSPLSVFGDTLTFSVGNLSPDSLFNIELNFNTDQSQPIGTQIFIFASMNLPGDINVLNNFDTLAGIITSGLNKSNSLNVFNSKNVTQPLYVNSGKELVYTINFQNTTNQTINDVTIIDTISQKLDITTLRILRSSYKMPEINWYNGNKLSFNFRNLNLPNPSQNEEKSKGQLVYSIKPRLNVNPGDTINNQAYIYFDYFGPIATSKTINIIRAITSSTQDYLNQKESNIVIFPNPTRDYIVIKDDNNQDLYYEIIDIQAKTTIGKTKNTSEKIDISSLSNGVYFIKLYNKSQVIKYQKLVITK